MKYMLLIQQGVTPTPRLTGSAVVELNRAVAVAEGATSRPRSPLVERPDLDGNQRSS